MTKIILAIVLFLATLLSFSQDVETISKNKKITVTVKNAPNDLGKIYFSIYKKEGFSKRNPIQQIESTIKNGIASVTFNIEESDTYAILCYHDSNSNSRMDFAETGMPLEDYGASNNIMKFGPPKFEDSKFELKDIDLNIFIKF
ncbi:MAG: DUF2141 domain-containing protein [Flavobacteriaceae bacterium]